MKIYLDMCCLKRPFDNQSQPRIAMETSAILGVLAACESGKYVSLRSSAHDLENALNPDARRGAAVRQWLDKHPRSPMHPPALSNRVEDLRRGGLSGFDALHLAWAELLEADRFLTTDDRLQSRASRLTSRPGMTIMNPVRFVEQEVS